MEQQADRKEWRILAAGIPIILTMMLQAVYNIVDSAFVSNIAGTGELALNALTLAFPFQMLVVAISIGTGVGMNVQLSKSIGQGDSEKAGRVVGSALFLGIVIYAAFLLFGLFGAGAAVSAQTSNPAILEMGTDYLTITSTLSFGMIFFVLFEKKLQATGRIAYATAARIIGLAVNAVLDPILIYGVSGFSGLGVRGAAFASVIGQTVSAALGLIFCLKRNTEVKKTLRYLKPDGEVIREIYKVGLPVLIAQTLIAVTSFCMNLILVRIAKAAVTAYGLYYRIYQVLLFAAFGMRDAVRPFLSYSYGQKDRNAMNDIISRGMRYILIIMVVGIIAIEIFARPISSIFGLSGATQEMAVTAMRVISLSLVFAGANVAYHGYFQVLEARRQAFLIPVFRQIVFLLPVAFGFSLIVGQDTAKLWIVWLTFLIAELVTMLIAMGFMRKIQWEKIDILDPAAKRREQELRKEQSLRDLDMPSNWF